MIHSPMTNPSAQPSALALPDGTQRLPLGSGIITRLLGEGGMANVYEIWNAQLEVLRAVKLMKPTCTRDNLERFQTEIKISAKLHHPNIIEIYSVGTWNNLPFIEMEKVDGLTLRDLLQQRGALPLEVCCAIVLMVGRALHHAHTQECSIYGKTYHGIIHRDLKPENIMICSNGVVKLMDFGIARPTEASFHTIDGYVVGTLQYLSPEQLSCQELDRRTDIYSLGTMFYEMITGVQAFPDKNIKSLITEKSSNRYKPLRDFAIELPVNLQRLVQRCMEHNPDQRPAGVDQLLVTLGKIYSRLTTLSPEELTVRFFHQPPGDRVVVRTVPRRRHWPMIAAALTLAAAGLTGAWLIWGTHVPDIIALVRTRVVTPELPSPPADPLPAAPVVRPDPPATEQQPVAVAHTIPPAPSPAPQNKVASAPSRAAKVVTPAPTVSSVPAAPLPALPPAVSAAVPTLLQSMVEKHGIADPVEILRKESRAGNHTGVLALCTEFDKDPAAATAAAIYRLRTLAAQGRRAELATALDRTRSDDGECLLYKAQVALDRQDVAGAERLAAQALGAPRAFLEYDALRQEVYLLQARCATARFERAPGEDSWSEASGAWWRIKNELRATPAHRYYRLAETELRRIGTMIRSSGGE